MNLFEKWYHEHMEEMGTYGLLFPYLVNHTIGKQCSLNPNEDNCRDKIFSILNRFGYGDGLGTSDGYKSRKRMYQYICEYYKWYKENENGK